MSSRLAPGLRIAHFRTLAVCLLAAVTSAPSSAQSGHPDDGYWMSGFGTPGMGTGGREAVVADGKLYVSDATYVVPTEGGGFDRAQLAVWDGMSWSIEAPGALSLGHGLNDIERVGTDTYIAGNFTSVGGVSASYIARWDGSAWSALGDGVNGFVTALATDGNGNLYVGGTFTQAGGQPARHVAKWDGSS